MHWRCSADFGGFSAALGRSEAVTPTGDVPAAPGEPRAEPTNATPPRTLAFAELWAMTPITILNALEAAGFAESSLLVEAA